MGLMDFIKGELIDIIEWTDDSRDTLSYRFPDDDKAIKNGAQLIVRESQVAQFVYLGEFGDTFKPGKHSLTTDNIPVLTSCDIAYDNCTMTSNFWGDLDELELANPGVFKGQPLVFDIYGITGGANTTATLTVRARMLKK